MINWDNLLIVIAGSAIILAVCYWIGEGSDRAKIGALVLALLWGMATVLMGYSVLDRSMT